MNRNAKKALALLLSVSILSGCSNESNQVVSASNDSGALLDIATPDPTEVASSNTTSVPEESVSPESQPDDFREILAVMPDKDANDSDTFMAYKQVSEEQSLFDFDVKMFRMFMTSGNKNKNKVYSPINIFMALSMLSDACDGKTRDEICSVLGMTDTKDIRSKANAIWNLNYYKENATKIANSVWLSNKSLTTGKPYDFNNNLLDIYANSYHASGFMGTMGSSKMDEALQSWTNENTGHLLEKEVSELNTDASTIMELISTIYFKSAWQDGFSFDKKNTKKEKFNGKTKKSDVDMMHKILDGDSLIEYEQFTKYEYPLNNGKMQFFLPNKGVSFDDIFMSEDFIASLYGEPEHVVLKSKTKRGIIDFKVPKFDVKLKSKLEDKDMLRSLGINAVFKSGVADLSKLFLPGSKSSELESPYVDHIEHTATVKIDEKGAEAAAYTDIGMKCETAVASEKLKTYKFYLNKPFLYAITGEDGTILFVGSIYDL